jgi:membrane-associated phospholipid phosphatase
VHVVGIGSPKDQRQALHTGGQDPFQRHQDRDWAEEELTDEKKTAKVLVRQRWGDLTALARGRALVIFSGLFAAVFTLLTAVVLEEGLQATWWDTELTRLSQSVPRVPWGELLIWVSVPGFPPWNWAVPTATVLLLALVRRFWDAAFMALASLGGLTAGLVKIVLDRPRPPTEVARPVGAELHGLSFPSGHVTEYVTVFGFIFYLAYTLLPPGSLVRWMVLFVSASMVLLVGPSRIYMGQHWASDSLAGYALGFTYLFIVIELHRFRLRRHAHTQVRTVAKGAADSEQRKLYEDERDWRS